MPKFTIFKTLELKVTVEAETAQAAYEAQLELDDNTFEVLECDYSVFDERNENVSHEVEIT